MNYGVARGELQGSLCTLLLVFVALLTDCRDQFFAYLRIIADSFRTCGLAPLIRHSYASAQAKFISFCRQLGNLHPSWSPCLMDEWTLCLIVMFPARTLQHLLIKVNLSGFRALHMDQGCSHLLADCLRLQRDIHGIKRCQGTPSSMRLLIGDEIS